MPIDWPKVWICWLTGGIFGFDWLNQRDDRCQLTGPKLGIANRLAKYLDLINWIHVTKGADWLVQYLDSIDWIWVRRVAKWLAHSLNLIDQICQFTSNDWIQIHWWIFNIQYWEKYISFTYIYISFVDIKAFLHISFTRYMYLEF